LTLESTSGDNTNDRDLMFHLSGDANEGKKKLSVQAIMCHISIDLRAVSQAKDNVCKVSKKRKGILFTSLRTEGHYFEFSCYP